MKTLIIGFGEVGEALYEILINTKPDILDMEEGVTETFEIIHICFPYSEHFVKEVKRYQRKYKPKYTVIHSTVPVGTSKECDAIHSPIVGIHPYLVKSIETFTKFLGGKDADKVADHFRKAGIKVYVTDKSETTELMKIMSTDFYGLCIEYTKEVKKMCDKYKVPFEMWTLWTNNYNQGYTVLGHPEFNRPNLIPITKKIGGHCILPNLLYIDNDFIKLIRKRNGK